MAFSKIIFNGTTLMDVTQDTVAADNLLAGETATGADGQQVTGAYVPSGGGVQEVECGAIFVDYDGTLIDAWEAADVAGKTALPNNPSHTDIGLTSQGWNWALADIKSYISDYPTAVLTIGQLYTTTSGASELDCTFDSNTLAPYLGIAVNGTAVIDWGDNSATSTLTGTSLTTLKWANHTYSAAGNYTISITPQSGSYVFYYSGSAGGVLARSSSFTSDRTYRGCINAVRVGANANLANLSFNGLLNAKYITLPSTVTTIGSETFSSCYGIRALTIPTNVTSLGDWCVNGSQSLNYISLPKGLTSIGQQCFSESAVRFLAFPTGITSIAASVCNQCATLRNLTLSNNITSVGQYSFRYTRALRTVHLSTKLATISSSAFYSANVAQFGPLPSSVTSIGGSAFYYNYSSRTMIINEGVTSIPSSCFYQNYSLSFVELPSTLTSIAAQAFYGDFSLAKIRFNRSTPPTVANSNAWSSVPTSCVISVPVGSLSSYTSASNYPSSSTYTYIEEA